MKVLDLIVGGFWLKLLYFYVISKFDFKYKSPPNRMVSVWENQPHDYQVWYSQFFPDPTALLCFFNTKMWSWVEFVNQYSQEMNLSKGQI